MKWFDKWFKNKCIEAWNNRHDEPEVAPSIHGKNLTVRSAQSIDSPGMNFTVYRANGGHVIETRVYDRHKDRNNMGLHVITDDKDLGDEIGKIITFENLRN